MIEIPSISNVSLVPDNVSPGGFRLVASHEPDTGSEVECTIQLGDMKLERYSAKVAWVRQNQTIPPTWSIGLSVFPENGSSRTFDKALRKYASQKP